MTTQKNLEVAFAGESQANRKYLAFAEKADQEGYKQVAKTLNLSKKQSKIRHQMQLFSA